MLAASALTNPEVDALLDGLCSVAEHIELHYRLRPVLRDPSDEIVLETAVVGRADVLVTFNVRDFRGAEHVGARVLQPGPAWHESKEFKP